MALFVIKPLRRSFILGHEASEMETATKATGKPKTA
jgi:hypothetical protein